MWSTSSTVNAGDTVIIYLTRDLIQPLLIQPGKHFNTKFGNYTHDQFIGVVYGSKVPAPSGRGFLYLLRPTPELWTLALPHRTQILYIADISFITSFLNIKSGSTVIEAGTGSGSFSHSIARSVGSNGRLYSYEFHEARYLKAKAEFTEHGMDDIVTLTHRNVCKDGFTIDDLADAVFLDLPAPWEAAEHAKKALRKDKISRICCFSPCIEQVLRTVTALNDAGFSEITTYETLLRPIEVFQIPTLPSISSVSSKIKEGERKREEKRLRQVKENKERAERKRRGGGGEKRKRDEEGEGEEGVDGEKRAKVDEDEDGKAVSLVQVEADLDADADAEGDVDMDVDVAIPDSNPNPESGLSSPHPNQPPETISTAQTPPTQASQPLLLSTSSPSSSKPIPVTLPSKLNLGKALPEVRGHTSYLTFAVLVPRVGASGEGSKGEGVEGAGAAEGPGEEGTKDVDEAGPGVVNGTTPAFLAVDAGRPPSSSNT